MVPLLALLVSCTSESVTGTVQNEPVCADFMLGSDTAILKGSLKKPVKVSVLDGSTVRWERVILGKRSASDAPSKFVVEDDDETYTVRWAQCPNVFAPRRVEMGSERDADVSVTYSCGEAATYNEHPLEIREGDSASRVLTWVAPPEPACWSGTPPPPGSASSSASATAPDASARTPTASASAAAGASATPSGSAVRGAPPVSPGSSASPGSGAGVPQDPVPRDKSHSKIPVAPKELEVLSD